MLPKHQSHRDDSINFFKTEEAIPVETARLTSRVYIEVCYTITKLQCLDILIYPPILIIRTNDSRYEKYSRFWLSRDVQKLVIDDEVLRQFSGLYIRVILNEEKKIHRRVQDINQPHTRHCITLCDVNYCVLESVNHNKHMIVRITAFLFFFYYIQLYTTLDRGKNLSAYHTQPVNLTS